MKYYVYQHLKADTKEVFYVGKGQDDRAWGKKGRNRYWGFIVSKHGFDVELIAYFKVEQDAYDFEIEKIAEHKINGITLVNMTVGGEGGGVPGLKRTAQACKNISLAKQGKNNPMYGVKQTKEQIAKRLEWLLDTEKKEAAYAKSSKKRTGIAHTAERVEKVRKANTGKKRTEEQRLKMKRPCIRKGKTNIEFYGEEEAKEMKISKRKFRKITEEQQRSVYDEYCNGTTVKELAEKYGIHKDTCRKYINEFKNQDI